MTVTKLRTIGRHVMVSLPDLGVYEIEAKVDTGAFRTVIHCISCSPVEIEGKQYVEALFNLDGLQEKKILFEDYFLKEFKSSFGEKEIRYCVKTKIIIGRKKILSQVSFTDRSDMKFQVLIGRKTLLKKFVVDVSKKLV